VVVVVPCVLPVRAVIVWVVRVHRYSYRLMSR
jgi:hypothetical protein